MPLIESTYTAPRFLRHGHLQTVLPLVLPRRRVVWTMRERFELPDADFVDLDWRRGGRSRAVILAHGLEGSAQAIYMRGMAGALGAAGWDVVGWNFRGCSGEPNRLVRSYHSGESGDLRTIVDHVANQYGQIALIGFSLGGNITLKYLGEQPAHPAVCAAVAISSPVDLKSSASALDACRSNWLYLQRFLRALVAKVQAKALQFPDQLDAAAFRQVRTFQDFDNRYTAPIHGFLDAEDYWARASSLPYLPSITVPTLLINALNDPLLGSASFPRDAAASNSALFLETPLHGGHVGFLDFRAGLQPWHEARAVAFLKEVVRSTR